MLTTMNMNHSKEKIQLIKELHRPIRRNFPRRRTIIKGLDDLWQSDLAQMDLYARANKNFKFILVIIDCFSKYMWAKPLKNKSSDEVTKAFESILREGRSCKNLNTDQGKEYYNANFKKLMQKYNINHYSTFSHLKASMAERLIRTLKEKLFKYFSLNGTYKWIDILPKIVENYNTQKHSKTKMRPADVNKKNEEEIRKSIYSHLKIAGARKLKVGDVVRISKAKQVFEKGYTPNWSTELFKIIKIQITNPVTYLLEDLQGRPIKGGFYEEEIQKTANPDVYLVEKILQRKGNKVKVRWLGFNSSHDSWIGVKNKL